MKAISSLKRLGAYIKPYKVQFILVLLFTVATVGFRAADHQRCPICDARFAARH